MTSKESEPAFDSLFHIIHGTMRSSCRSSSSSSSSGGGSAFRMARASSFTAIWRTSGTPNLTMPSIRIQRMSAYWRDALVVECPPNTASEITSPEPATHAPTVHCHENMARRRMRCICGVAQA